MKLPDGYRPPMALLLLSALWAAGWLLPELFPSSGARVVSLPLGQTVLFSVLAAISSAIALGQRQEFPSGRRAWAWAMTGMGLFVIPAVASGFAQGKTSNFDEIAVVCLTPVLAVVLEPHFPGEAPPIGRAALSGALLAVAGVLCFFPLDTPKSPRSAVALAVVSLATLIVAAANCVAVRLAWALPSRSILPMAAQASASAALGFAVLAAFTRSTAWDSVALQTYLLRLFLVDIPGLFLLFWLMGRLSASRMTARFLLAPLLASLTGLALEQIPPSPRSLLGIALMAGGSVWLVFAPAEAATQNPMSLKTMFIQSQTRPPRQD